MMTRSVSEYSKDLRRRGYECLIRKKLFKLSEMIPSGNAGCVRDTRAVA